MDLVALRAFLAVVDSGSFAGAATALRLPRATLRRRIDELEMHAGVPLLHRTEQGTTPTESGLVFVERGRELLANSAALVSSVREVGVAPSGLLRVVMPPGLPPLLIASLYGALRAKHPALRFSLRVVDNPAAHVLEDTDLAFFFGEHVPEGSWTAHVLAEIPERLLASEAYLSLHGVPRTVEDLQKHSILFWEGSQRGRSVLPLKAGGEVAVVPTGMCTDTHILRHCAAMGLGLAFCPDADIPDPLSPTAALVPVLDDLVGRPCFLSALVPSIRAEVPRIQALFALIKELFPGLAPGRAPVGRA